MSNRPVATVAPEAASTKRILAVSLALAALTYVLMVLGATVRAMDAGLSCPDWPLCHGQWFPPFEPILTEAPPVPTPAQMNAEWFHRLLAAFVSAGLVGLGVLAWRTGRPVYKRLMAAAFGLLLAQVLMGAATVYMGNIHYSVAIHLALATSLLLVVSWVGRLAAGPGALQAWLPGAAMPEGLRRSSGIFLGVLGATILLGAFIAKTPGADLVCPVFPACGRDDYEGVAGLVALQMTHRLLALAFLAWALAVAWAVRSAPSLRRGAFLLAGLTTLQVALGIVNVYLRVPIPVSAAHLGTAVAMFFVLFHWRARGA